MTQVTKSTRAALVVWQLVWRSRIEAGQSRSSGLPISAIREEHHGQRMFMSLNFW